MKKLIYLLVLIPFLLSKTCFGDVIIGNVHYVEKCVKITNIDDYPEVSLLGFIPPSSAPYDTYIINSSQCLTKGYKYNDFNVFAINKEYLIGKDIKKIDLPRDPNAISSNLHIELYGGYLNDSIPISGIEQYYKIVGFTATSIVLHKWKEVNKFNNGKPDSTSTYTYDGEISELYQKIQTGIHSYQSSSNIELYPNPAKKIIHFKLIGNDQGIVPIEIVTLNGKVVKSLTLRKNGILLEYDIPLENIRSGAYLVNIKLGAKVESRKIVIK